MFALRMTVAQREKLALLGGAEWLRGKIDKAKTPNASGNGQAGVLACPVDRRVGRNWENE